MKDTHRTSVLNRLKTARGHLDAVVRMVEDDAYCPDVMKQLSAVQGSLERGERRVLRVVLDDLRAVTIPPPTTTTTAWSRNLNTPE